MSMSSMKIFTICLIFSTLIVGYNGNLQNILKTPPHCTRVTKNTDYNAKFTFNYPVAYIHPGQHVAYQQMYCINPAAVNTAVTTVCDWTAPPQVQFTLGDEYVHIVRQDPSGQFPGNAVITTSQICSHNISQAQSHTLPINSVCQNPK